MTTLAPSSSSRPHHHHGGISNLYGNSSTINGITPSPPAPLVFTSLSTNMPFPTGVGALSLACAAAASNSLKIQKRHEARIRRKQREILPKLMLGLEKKEKEREERERNKGTPTFGSSSSSGVSPHSHLHSHSHHPHHHHQSTAAALAINSKNLLLKHHQHVELSENDDDNAGVDDAIDSNNDLAASSGSDFDDDDLIIQQQEDENETEVRRINAANLHKHDEEEEEKISLPQIPDPSSQKRSLTIEVASHHASTTSLHQHHAHPPLTTRGTGKQHDHYHPQKPFVLPMTTTHAAFKRINKKKEGADGTDPSSSTTTLTASTSSAAFEHHSPNIRIRQLLNSGYTLAEEERKISAYYSTIISATNAVQDSIDSLLPNNPASTHLPPNVSTSSSHAQHTITEGEELDNATTGGRASPDSSSSPTILVMTEEMMRQLGMSDADIKQKLEEQQTAAAAASTAVAPNPSSTSKVVTNLVEPSSSSQQSTIFDSLQTEHDAYRQSFAHVSFLLNSLSSASLGGSSSQQQQQQTNNSTTTVPNTTAREKSSTLSTLGRSASPAVASEYDFGSAVLSSPRVTGGDDPSDPLSPFSNVFSYPGESHIVVAQNEPIRMQSHQSTFSAGEMSEMISGLSSHENNQMNSGSSSTTEEKPRTEPIILIQQQESSLLTADSLSAIADGEYDSTNDSEADSETERDGEEENGGAGSEQREHASIYLSRNLQREKERHAAAQATRTASNQQQQQQQQPGHAKKLSISSSMSNGSKGGGLTRNVSISSTTGGSTSNYNSSNNNSSNLPPAPSSPSSIYRDLHTFFVGKRRNEIIDSKRLHVLESQQALVEEGSEASRLNINDSMRQKDVTTSRILQKYYDGLKLIKKQFHHEDGDDDPISGQRTPAVTMTQQMIEQLEDNIWPQPQGMQTPTTTAVAATSTSNNKSALAGASNAPTATSATNAPVVAKKRVSLLARMESSKKATISSSPSTTSTSAAAASSNTSTTSSSTSSTTVTTAESSLQHRQKLEILVATLQARVASQDELLSCISVDESSTESLSVSGVNAKPSPFLLSPPKYLYNFTSGRSFESKASRLYTIIHQLDSSLLVKQHERYSLQSSIDKIQERIAKLLQYQDVTCMEGMEYEELVRKEEEVKKKHSQTIVKIKEKIKEQERIGGLYTQKNTSMQSQMRSIETELSNLHSLREHETTRMNILKNKHLKECFMIMNGKVPRYWKGVIGDGEEGNGDDDEEEKDGEAQLTKSESSTSASALLPSASSSALASTSKLPSSTSFLPSLSSTLAPSLGSTLLAEYQDPSLMKTVFMRQPELEDFDSCDESDEEEEQGMMIDETMNGNGDRNGDLHGTSASPTQPGGDISESEADDMRSGSADSRHSRSARRSKSRGHHIGSAHHHHHHHHSRSSTPFTSLTSHIDRIISYAHSQDSQPSGSAYTQMQHDELFGNLIPQYEALVEEVRELREKLHAKKERRKEWEERYGIVSTPTGGFMKKVASPMSSSQATDATNENTNTDTIAEGDESQTKTNSTPSRDEKNSELVGENKDAAGEPPIVKHKRKAGHSRASSMSMSKGAAAAAAHSRKGSTTVPPTPSSINAATTNGTNSSKKKLPRRKPQSPSASQPKPKSMAAIKHAHAKLLKKTEALLAAYKKLHDSPPATAGDANSSSFSSDTFPSTQDQIDAMRRHVQQVAETIQAQLTQQVVAAHGERVGSPRTGNISGMNDLNGVGGDEDIGASDNDAAAGGSSREDSPVRQHSGSRSSPRQGLPTHTPAVGSELPGSNLNGAASGMNATKPLRVPAPLPSRTLIRKDAPPPSDKHKRGASLASNPFADPSSSSSSSSSTVLTTSKPVGSLHGMSKEQFEAEFVLLRSELAKLESEAKRYGEAKAAAPTSKRAGATTATSSSASISSPSVGVTKQYSPGMTSATSLVDNRPTPQSNNRLSGSSDGIPSSAAAAAAAAVDVVIPPNAAFTAHSRFGHVSLQSSPTAKSHKSFANMLDQLTSDTSAAEGKVSAPQSFELVMQQLSDAFPAALQATISERE